MDKKEKGRFIEGEFSRYRLFKRLEAMRQVVPETKMTASYEPQYGHGGGVSKPVENAVVNEMVKREQRQTFIAVIEKAVSLLDAEEREIIECRYMKKDYCYDVHVYETIGISHKLYTIRRDAAIENLYLLLSVGAIEYVPS